MFYKLKTGSASLTPHSNGPRISMQFVFLSVIISPQTYYFLIVKLLNGPEMNYIESESPTLSRPQGNNFKLCSFNNPFSLVKNL